MTNMLPASVGADGRVNLFVGNVSRQSIWDVNALTTVAALPSEMAGSEGSIQKGWDGVESGCELGTG
jgi:hypothetical protein